MPDQVDTLGHDTLPLFSVITICFHDPDGLRCTAESVLAQERGSFEWLVIDGASGSTVTEYLDSIRHPALSYVSEPDTGIYNAMNKGVSLARGRYLIFMNSGDAFAYPNELEQAARDIAKYDPDLLYGDAIEVDGDSVHLKRARSSARYWYSMFTHHQAIYYHRRIFANRRYDETFRLAADWALTADVLREGGTARYVERVICRFLRGGASFSNQRARADDEARRVYRDHIRLSPALLWLVPRVKFAINRLRASAPRLYDKVRMQ
jgi:putative colanic acid biosynthesis glycosyltransferase